MAKEIQKKQLKSLQKRRFNFLFLIIQGGKKMQGGLGNSGDQYHIVNFAEDSGEHAIIDETTVMAVFVAPKTCEILDIGLAVTTAVAAHSSNHWTIGIANQTGDVALLSDEFDTDSDNSGNGGRSLTEDGLTSLCDNGSGNNYLQNTTILKGDILLLTATKAASATSLAYPQIMIKWRP